MSKRTHSVISPSCPLANFDEPDVKKVNTTSECRHSVKSPSCPIAEFDGHDVKLPRSMRTIPEFDEHDVKPPRSMQTTPEFDEHDVKPPRSMRTIPEFDEHDTKPPDIMLPITSPAAMHPSLPWDLHRLTIDIIIIAFTVRLTVTNYFGAIHHLVGDLRTPGLLGTVRDTLVINTIAMFSKVSFSALTNELSSLYLAIVTPQNASFRVRTYFNGEASSVECRSGIMHVFIESAQYLHLLPFPVPDNISVTYDGQFSKGPVYKTDVLAELDALLERDGLRVDQQWAKADGLPASFKPSDNDVQEGGELALVGVEDDDDDDDDDGDDVSANLDFKHMADFRINWASNTKDINDNTDFDRHNKHMQRQEENQVSDKVI